MQFPIYDMHYYIGFPVLLWLAYDSYKRYRKNQNISSLYIACASLSMSLSMFTFGFPALFTNDPRTLSFFTFIGDCSQIAGFLFLWLLSIRAFLSSKPKIMFIANTFVLGLAIISMIEAMIRNLTFPYSTSIVKVSNTFFDIVYKDTLRYNILTAINSLSLFLLSFYFWKQSNSAPNKAQSLRIRALSIAFFISSLVFIVMPAIPIPGLIDIKDSMLTLIFLIIALSAIIGHFISKREPTPSLN